MNNSRPDSITLALPAPEPPHSADTEAAALGSALISATAAQQVVELLTAADFHVPRNKIIFGAIYDVAEWGLVVDTLTVPEQLKAEGRLEAAGGLDYVLALPDSAPSAKHIDDYIKLLLEQTELREAYYRTQRIAAVYTAPDLSDAEKHQLNADILEQGRDRAKTEIYDAPAWMAATSAAFGPDAEGKAILGVPLGITRLDSILQGGWLPGNLYVIAGNSGMGKTAAAVECMQAAAFYDHPVGIVSLEMTKEQLGARFQSAETARWDVNGGVPLINILNHANPDLPEVVTSCQQDQLLAAKAALRHRPMFIHDGADMTFPQIVAVCSQMARRHGVKVIFIDYLQIIEWEAKLDTNTALERITKQAKSLAKRLDVAIVLLSQLTKENERRPKELQRPSLNDLRGSGSIRQNADGVILLHRPQYYERQQQGLEDDGTGESEWIVAKNRQGPSTVVKLQAALGVCRYYEAENRFGEPPPIRRSENDDRE